MSSTHRAIRVIESDIDKANARIAEAERIGQLMSCAGSDGFVKLIESLRDGAVQGMASLDPRMPNLAIEYAGLRRVKDTVGSLLSVLTGFSPVLAQYKAELLKLNGELQDAVIEKKRREDARI